MSTYVQDPDDTEVYLFLWSSMLVDGETVTSHQVAAPGLTVEASGVNANGDCWVRVSGGTDGAEYAVTSTVETSLARQRDHTMSVVVRSTHRD